MNKKHILCLTLLSISLQSSARVPLVSPVVGVCQRHPYLSGVALGATVASSAKVRETLKLVACAYRDGIIKPVTRKIVNSRAFNASCVFMRQLLRRWTPDWRRFNLVHLDVEVGMNRKGLNELIALRDQISQNLRQELDSQDSTFFFRGVVFKLTLDQMREVEQRLSLVIDYTKSQLN